VTHDPTRCLLAEGHDGECRDEITLHRVDPKIVRERAWQLALQAMHGYLFDIRVGGGPDTFTAWTVVREDGVDVPFVQATGDDPTTAIRALLDRLLAEGYQLVRTKKLLA
jgi:hypothetical protein